MDFTWPLMRNNIARKDLDRFTRLSGRPESEAAETASFEEPISHE